MGIKARKKIRIQLAKDILKLSAGYCFLIFAWVQVVVFLDGYRISAFSPTAIYNLGLIGLGFIVLTWLFTFLFMLYSGVILVRKDYVNDRFNASLIAHINRLQEDRKTQNCQ